MTANCPACLWEMRCPSLFKQKKQQDPEDCSEFKENPAYRGVISGRNFT